MRRSALAAAAAGLFVSVLAHAEPLNYNVVSLEASSSKEVSNDLATATLYVEISNTDPAQLADKVNQTLAAAIRLSRQFTTVQSAGTGYTTYPVYNNKTNHQDGWRGRGELRLSSRDFAAFSRLLTQLQQPLSNGQSMQLAGIRYGVSDESRKAAEDGLIQESVKAFRQRAELIQRSMEGTGWRTVNMSVNTQAFEPPMPRPMLVKAAMSADAAPAPTSIEGGESKVSVTVSGSIQVQ
ncbi:SIMPL domain-containing protein [Silvimonas amylolytica]|uniref:SIMPL domain-containing protein n=1 Tax=Silvimonas amylolytica TaxID=449663 RepID=A0ABQ2PLN0_9NEIS|nr:SIMPL domain-containing protein [Silvimonas amylolytica]GGP26372.1 SIMPL domain-containing protein [Silvimonas amylolytica]